MVPRAGSPALSRSMRCAWVRLARAQPVLVVLRARTARRALVMVGKAHPEDLRWRAVYGVWWVRRRLLDDEQPVAEAGAGAGSGLVASADSAAVVPRDVVHWRRQCGARSHTRC